MTALLDLPPELINHIILFLSKQDVRTVRLACGQLEHICFDAFAHLFFRKKGFMITSDSLAVLRDISLHDGLRKHVQHIWFNPDCLTFVPNPSDVFDGSGHEESSSEEAHAEKNDAFQSYTADHWVLLHTPKLYAMLCGILGSLPMLKTIGMRRGEDHKPYGWRMIYERTGIDPRVLGGDYSHFALAPSDSTYLFVAILKALSATRLSLRRLYTDAIQLDHIDQEQLPSRTSLQKCLRSIQYLEINITGPSTLTDTEQALHNIDSSLYGQNSENVLRSMPGLLEIGITIFRDSKQRHMVPPVPYQPSSWRSSYPYLTFERLSKNVRLPALRRVKLEKICTTSRILIGFLESASTFLMSLKLRHIQLLSDVPPEGKAWTLFFSFLQHRCRSLEYLLLHALTYDGSSVRFSEHLPPPMARERIPAVGDVGSFTEYSNINVEVVGQEAIAERLTALVDQHWDGTRLFSYAMDDSIWFTDTSDEDW